MATRMSRITHPLEMQLELSIERNLSQIKSANLASWLAGPVFSGLGKLTQEETLAIQ